MRIAITKKGFQKLNPTITHQSDHNNFSESILYALIMENVDRSNGLERFLEIRVKSQVN